MAELAIAAFRALGVAYYGLFAALAPIVMVPKAWADRVMPGPIRLVRNCALYIGERGRTLADDEMVELPKSVAAVLSVTVPKKYFSHFYKVSSAVPSTPPSNLPHIHP